ncbi:MAG: hypothetical protein EXS31_03880 [Pedosphaera sp.]|nr:hypothetical protein [Pedosphaera sp.]
MSESLFGMETEYGFAVRDREAVRAGPNRDWATRFMNTARDCLAHLPATDGGGIFLPNGARFYIDSGHPEMTTPECANPWDLVRYMHAGERVLSTVAAELKRHSPSAAEVLLFKTNVDHSGSGSTWGCHTSFMHRADPGKLPEQIIPHLVSRIVYSGAGGIELAGSRLAFTLSPRVAFLKQEFSNNSTSDRGIFHTKDETLAADGFHRLHIICGESVCSETALWLNMGATAVIAAMIEAGLQPGRAVQLMNPLSAMQRFAADPACQATTRTLGGRQLSAVQIQRHYLEVAEAHVHAQFMPPWAERVCIEWRTMLDRLENGAPASVATQLDWAIKLSLFLERAGRRGVKEDQWQHARLNANSATILDSDVLLEEMQSLKLRRTDAWSIAQVHQELCEIDTRFGQLDGGIFSELDHAGVLTHRFPGVDNIEHAVAQPPAIGRAKLRGQCVQRFAAERKRFTCSWRGVVDCERRVMLDLSHPFTSEERWQEVPKGFRDCKVSIHDHLGMMVGQALAFHDRGNHESAAERLSEVGIFQDTFDSDLNYEFLRLRAWVQSRRGFCDSISALDELMRLHSLTFSLVNDYVCAYRHRGLVPAAAIERWIETGREFLAASDGNSGTAVAFLDHCGLFLLRNGHPSEAMAALEDACRPERRLQANPGVIARALADLGDVYRAVGRAEDAHRTLEAAERLQLAQNFEGDLADLTLTYRAKLDSDRAVALQLLDQVRAIQIRLHNRMGEARTLVLQARLLRDLSATAPIKSRLHELRGLRPALSQCPALAKVLDHWDDWVTAAVDPDGGTDFYWWL